MKFLFDLLPILLFFIAYKLYGIFVATGVAIATTVALIAYSKITTGKVDKMLMINGAIISILGGITLALHDKTFIMWKPTALYWLGAIALLISHHVLGKNLIQTMLANILTPPASTWSKLNWVWIVFLITLGGLNLYVAFNYTEETWVNFKLFGTTSLMFLFMIGQIMVLKRYIVEPKHDTNTPPSGD